MKRRNFLQYAGCSVVGAGIYSSAAAQSADKLTGKGSQNHLNMDEKTAILLVAFGTSYSEAQVALDNIDDRVKKAFPKMEVRWAFTSKIIRHKLEKQGKHIDSPAEALAKIGDDGFSKIAVQSLHVIPGDEYNDLKKTINAFRHIPQSAKKISLGKPLLFAHADVLAVCSVLTTEFKPNEAAGEAVLFMGHGTSHESNIFYPGTQYYLSRNASNYFLATVEGYPDLGDVIPKLKELKITRLTLVPFMSVAGDHARNDMAGDEPDSWKSVLEQEGYQVNSILKGMGELDSIVSIYIDHLKSALHELA